MISVENVTLRIKKKTILEDISFEIGKTEKAVISGESGAGKSSLFKTILSIYRPHKGRVVIDGLESNEKNIDEMIYL